MPQIETDMEKAPDDGTPFIALYFRNPKMSEAPHVPLTARFNRGQFETFDMDRWCSTSMSSLGGWMPWPEIPSGLFDKN